MGFYVRFDDIRSINEITVQQISKWQEELVALQGAMQKVIGLDSFQGETADSIKTYYNEIHNLLLSAIGSTMVDFMTKIMLYWDGYYSIDGDIHTKLNEDTLNKAIKEYDNSLDKLDTSQTSLKTTLDSVSDIFYSIIPAVGTLEYYHDDAKDKIISVKDKVIPYEESVLNNELANLRELIENTIAYIREYKNGDRNIMIHYSSGDYMNDENIYNLAVSMNKAQEYQQIHQKDLEEAISQQKKVYEQLQEEYEAEIEKLAKERADQGTAQVIMGVFAVGVGFAAIVLTAGAATPLVVTAAVTGTCSMAYGLSEVSEGTQHVYYGLNGDPYTSAFNPLRDTIFMGNQEVYSMWGNINMTVAGLCIPVGKSTQGLKGIEAIKAGGKAIAKEVVMDQASEFVASYTVPVISDAMNIDSTTGKTLLNLGVQMFTEGALEKGVDAAEVKIETQRIKIEAEASGKGLAGLMDEAEAARYESYWLNQDIDHIKIESETAGSVDSINRLEEVEVQFNYKSKYDEAEFARQLEEQQNGINQLSVQEYLDNRNQYIEHGRSKDASAAQQRAREQAFVDKIDELQDEGLSYAEAQAQAKEWIDTQAALHGPDQIAGGYAENVTGMGDKNINSSIGAQWRYRIDDLDAKIKEMAEGMTEEERKNTYLNIRLKYQGG